MTEEVCKYKEIYEGGIQAILETTIPCDVPFGFHISKDDVKPLNGGWKLKECPHIEVSITCPHMVKRPTTNIRLAGE